VLCSTNHPPPIANAAMPAAIPPYRTTWRRCLAIVTLGLTASLFFSPIRMGPWWWQPVLATAALLNSLLFFLYGSCGGVPLALVGGLLGRGLRALAENSAT